MFKSWKKKASTKVEPTENKRFSLLGSKKPRNPENHVVQDIKTYSYPLKANEKTQEVATQSYDPTAHNSKESPNHEVNSYNRLSTAPPTPIVQNIPQGAYIPPQVDYPVLSLNDNSNGSNTATSDIKNHEILHVENEKEQCTSTLERGNHSVENIVAPTQITILADELDQSNLVSEANEVDKGSIYQLNSQVQRLQRQVKDIRQYFKGLLRRDTEGLVTASIKIQALARGHLTRRIYRDYKFVKLRGYHAINRPMSLNQLRKECSAIGMLLVEENIDTKQDLVATEIQAVWRGHMVRKKVARYRQAHEAAIRIQSCWRGYRTREANPRIMVKILQKRSQEQQKSIQKLAREVQMLQIQMNEEIMIQKEHADSLDYLHNEVRTARAEKAISPQKSATIIRKPRQSSGPPAVDFSKFASQEDFSYLKAEIEFLHQRLEEFSMDAYLREDASR